MEVATELFPNGAWDVHHHIFDPARFAYSPNRHLTPPPATIDQFIAFKKTLGITKSVLTHGLSYGSDCSSLRGFVAELGTNDTKAIGVIDPQTVTAGELQDMRRAGICGIRVNLYQYKAMHDVQLQMAALRAHASAIRDVCPDWSMAFTHTHPEFWVELKPFLEREIVPSGTRIVTDHFALLKGASMLSGQGEVSEQPGFREILELMRSGHLYVKISAPYRVSNQAPEYGDLKPLVRAFFDANPTQVVWGSDWPHTPHMKVRTPEEALTETPYLNIDDLAWLRSLRSWLSDEEWNALMVDNPAALYN
ncbi:hypothetical protein ASPVEDRAFT_31668 [Aspergillus versicolor CBS 583.65]|uniref:Amidohydrolase-related domain-containing protein n=1 Tax=Aspergillus versicolor CBS 583.65 TaxID=1036611 RepID=A0A1L9PUP9_ASPVE|nr:uncharacterized protein ASPVEDRAFT_31668 [Aspergillus versicolor CBS 583.65]OJJ05280.1 hypothetical protein ASPVEDRAFT_31668 [Aspergillus versicolor CBS 583.65]